MFGIRFLAIAVLVCFALPSGDIARVDLNGAIDPVTAAFVVRCIERAENEHATML
jgi:membrane-bound ClpP family serine protease